MDIKSYILWMLLLAVMAITVYWHIKENKQLSKLWKNSLESRIATDLIRFAWSRTVQVFSVLGCLVLLVIIYDWQLNQSRTDIQTLNDTLTEERTLFARTNQPPPTPTLPPEVTKPPENAMADIYNPEESTPGNASAIDGLKKRYEEILVTYFFLSKCGSAQAVDYHIITSALSQEMASINAPGRLQNDILTAAKGSYKEMYSQTRCEGSGMEALQKQYRDYISALTKNFATP